MKHELLLAEVFATPWALMPERLRALIAVMHRAALEIPPDAATLERIASDRSARRARRQAALAESTGNIAVLPLYGVLTPRGNLVDEVSGAGMTSTQQFGRALQALIADESVSQVLIDIDSPGGSVYGVAELAAEIQSAREQKPVIAIANSLAASAAYWLGCAASELYVSPSGEVGSIGVWQAHQDVSAALEDAGVKTTLISAGKYKTEGHPYAPLDPPAQAFMQSRVDDYYAAFTKAVAKGRGVPIASVREGMGEGRVLGAEAALSQNMVDGIATFDEVLRGMRRAAATKTAPRVSRLKRAREALALI